MKKHLTTEKQLHEKKSHNENFDTILTIFNAISMAITLVNGIAVIIDKYHPKTLEEFSDRLKNERISKNN